MDSLTLVIGLAVLGVVLALLASRARYRAISHRLDRLSRIEGKLDALLKAGNVSFDPLAEVPASVREALARGETILAIKRLRESTGIGLKEAKGAVDEIRRRSQPAMRPTSKF